MPSPQPFTIRVPATSANLGPGYDCLGLAVNLWLEVTVEEAARYSFTYEGEGHLPDNRQNLTNYGFTAAFRELGLEPPEVAFRVNNPIPLARGLGSSSAALVAGAAAADVLSGGRLGRDGVFQLCARAEGHPDNVAPAVYGGFTVSASENGGFVTRALPLPAEWRFLFAVPEFELTTVAARKVVPAEFSLADVITTASHAALWPLAVATADTALLQLASRDVLHQPYREPLLPGFAAAVSAARDAGAWAVFLSGAGPTIGAVCSAEALGPVREALASYGRVLELAGAGGFEVSGAPGAP